MKPTWKTRFPITVIAHRGFAAEAPENTLAAFRRAIAAGSDVLELDIHLSKDRELVVIHDRTLERTTNGQGRVSDFTLKELKRLDAGIWRGPQFSGERIPSLREVLDLTQGRVGINVEIKDPPHGLYPIEEIAERALQEVKKENMLDTTLFSSFHPQALERIQTLELGARVALLCDKNWNLLQEVTAGKSWPVLNLRKDFLTREKIARIHQEGMEVNVYTVDAEEEIEQLIPWEIDGIITNHPGRLIKILEKNFASR